MRVGPRSGDPHVYLQGYTEIPGVRHLVADPLPEGLGLVRPHLEDQLVMEG